MLGRSRILTLASLLVGVSLLVSACGRSPGSHVAQLGSTTTPTPGSSSATPAGSAQQTALAAALAFSRCMRSHGVATFPDPDSQARFPPYSSASAQAKQAAASAQQACKRLLPSPSGGGVETRGAQQKLAFALQTARCMRSHGFPTYPDPPTPSPSSQGGGGRFDGTGIDIRSPRFQTAEVNCEQRARNGLGLP